MTATPAAHYARPVKRLARRWPQGDGGTGGRGSLRARCLRAAAGAALAAALLSTPASAQAPSIAPVKPATVRVSSASELNCVLRSQFKGLVIVPAGANWPMVGDDDCDPATPNDRPLTYMPLRSDVQLIGERGPLGLRPLLRVDYRAEGYPLFWIDQTNDVRIEGLHLVGPYAPRDRKNSLPGITALLITANPARELGRRIAVVDNEIQGFTNAVAVKGTIVEDEPSVYDRHEDCRAEPQRCRLRPAQADLIRVERNYLHNNAMKGGGYGVVVGGGAYVTAEGNVFEYNNHSMAADGRAYSGYVARFNYVLRGILTNHAGKPPHYFDVHGTGGNGTSHVGGRAGTRYDIVLNTFRGDLDYAFKLRGTPAEGVYFQGNVLVHDDYGDAVELDGGARRLFASQNRYDTDHSSDLATGDFDADGRGDVFVANGTAWFFSRAGRRPWEFLRASTKRLEELGFADVDNDRVTDVLYRDGAGRVGYLVGGRGDLVPLTTAPVPMRDLRFGDFDGDGRTDLFYTRAGQWRVWSGATRLWRATQTSDKPVSGLRFGDFDSRRGTDVAGVNRSGWAYSSGAATSWIPLNRLTRSFAGAVAADVDGNLRSDIVYGSSDGWRYSRDGRGPLTTLRRGDGGIDQRRVGRFAGDRREGIVSFGYAPYRDRLGVWTSTGAGNGLVRHSAENMR